MEAKISAYKAEQLHSFELTWNGYSFFMVVGKYFNGWFAAIPNWCVSVQIAEPSDVKYNAKKLAEALNAERYGTAVAEGIAEYFSKI